MSRKVVAGAAAAGVVAASVFIAGPASAHNRDPRLTIDVARHILGDGKRAVFRGRLMGEHPRCEAYETIRLKRIRHGILRTLRTTTTDAQGEYRFAFNPVRERGKWFTRYPGKDDFGYRKRHSCGAYRSRIVWTRHA